MRCTVAVCNNSWAKTKKDNSRSHIKYFTFPKNEELRKQWIQRCRRDGKWNPDSCRVCSEHFHASDFDRDLKSELLGLPTTRILKKDAIPSLNLGVDRDTYKEQLSYDREIRKEKRDHKKVVTEMLQDSDICMSNSTLSSPSPSVTPPPQTCDENAVALIEEIERLKKELDEERKTTLVLNFKLEAAERKLQQHRTKINNLRKELIACKKKERCAHNIHNKLVDGLSDIFTKTQIKVLTNKQKRVNWTDKDISAAFTLRYLGKKTYIYMRQKLHYPLPGLSTLEKWASKIDMRNGTGILEDMLGMMKIAAITYGQSDKIAVLQFDEVHVKRAYEYDSLKDEIVGPHSRLQAVMVRGLFKNWKQLIYVDFDKNMTKIILDNLVSRLAEIGYRVVACVCDMGAANQGLWKGYEVNPTKTWFYNPRTSERIYFFADAPHLLKLIRNWLLDTGFIFSNGKIVSKEPLESLIKDDNHEIKACHKIDSSHLNCRGTERMNVRKAAELMSHSVATALRHFKLGGDSSIAENTSEFIEIVNNWFDLMNSYSPAHSKVPSKNAYGLKLEEQDKILKNMCDTINSMTCRGKRVKQVFQTAILVSISSLKYLLLDVQKLGMTYILTHRLNQDSLENLFSQIRSRGGLYDHPTPLNSLYRLRMIILGNNAGNIEKHKNTHTESSEEYLSSQLLRTCGVKCTDLVQNSIPDIFIQEEDDTSGSGSTIVGEKETEMEAEGLRYIAGWIANKHSETHPNLGHRTDTEETDHSSYCLVSWIRSLSYGGLTEPTSKWLDIVKEMEKRFCSYHGPEVRRGVGVMKNLVSLICSSDPSVSSDLVKTFVKVRTYARIKFLNKCGEKIISGQKRIKRSEPTVKRKMKKFTN